MVRESDVPAVALSFRLALARPVASRLPGRPRPRPNTRDSDVDRARSSRTRRADDDDDWNDLAEPDFQTPRRGGTALVLAIVGGAVLMLGGGVALAVWAFASITRPTPPNPTAVVQRVEQNNAAAGPNVPADPVRVPKRRPRARVLDPGVKDDSTIPAGTLRSLKNATVFVKVQSGLAQASGTGFLVQSSRGEGFLVTNHHVVEPSNAAARWPGNPFPFGRPFPGFPDLPQAPMIGPRFPGFPGLPQPPIMGPRFGPFGGPLLQPPMFRMKPNVTLVLHSGTQEQEAITAEVVADDANADLAVLRVRPVTTSRQLSM